MTQRGTAVTSKEASFTTDSEKERFDIFVLYAALLALSWFQSAPVSVPLPHAHRAPLSSGGLWAYPMGKGTSERGSQCQNRGQLSALRAAPFFLKGLKRQDSEGIPVRSREIFSYPREKRNPGGFRGC